MTRPLALAVLCALAACSPGRPPAYPDVRVETRYGALVVYQHQCDWSEVDWPAYVERAYDRAREQIGEPADALPLDGTLVVGYRALIEHRGYAGRHRYQREIEADCRHPGVLTHELFHRFCHQLGHSGDCCTLQDHCGEPGGGYTPTCERCS